LEANRQAVAAHREALAAQGRTTPPSAKPKTAALSGLERDCWLLHLDPSEPLTVDRINEHYKMAEESLRDYLGDEAFEDPDNPVKLELQGIRDRLIDLALADYARYSQILSLDPNRQHTGDKLTVEEIEAAFEKKSKALRDKIGDPAYEDPKNPQRLRLEHARDWLLDVVDKTFTVAANEKEHYYVSAKINGREVPSILLDTGTTLVSLTYKTARSLGLTSQIKKYSVEAETQNGTIMVAPITIPEIRIGGGIAVKNVAAVVAEPGKGHDVLGMSFMDKLSIEIGESRLTLRSGANKIGDEAFEKPDNPVSIRDRLILALDDYPRSCQILSLDPNRLLTGDKLTVDEIEAAFEKKSNALRDKIGDRAYEDRNNPQRFRLELARTLLLSVVDKTLIVTADEDRMHYVSAEINGVKVPSMQLDAGATRVCLTYETAEALGLTSQIKKFSVEIKTANGTIMAAPITIPEIRIGGGIAVKNVAAYVIKPGQKGVDLLGMSFMGMLSIEIEGKKLTLKSK
jgi:clan AA aspartic protease (TIGR02281 family)